MAIREFDAGLARPAADDHAVMEIVRLIVAEHGLDRSWHDVAEGWVRSGLPPAWTIGALLVQASLPKADWPPAPCSTLQQKLADFCSVWAIKARDLGWSEREPFGCHKQAAWRRLDGQGLALRIHGQLELECLDQSGA